MEAQMYLPSYMREVAQSGNLNHNQHANHVELLADFAEKINVDPAALVTVMFSMGEMVTANQSLDEDTCLIGTAHPLLTRSDASAPLRWRAREERFSPFSARKET